MASLPVDHLVYAVQDLEAAIERFTKLTGVRPIYGGPHPGRGSHNALMSLGNRAYLEIIAPDPDQPEPSVSRSFGLDNLSTPQLRTWAVRTTNIAGHVARSRDRGYDPGVIYDGSRRTSEGQLLRWQLTRRPEAVLGGNPPGDWLIPFVIDWGTTPHPAASAPEGCTLKSLRGKHARPSRVNQWLTALGVDLELEAGPAVQLEAVIETPNGEITLV